MEVAVPGCSPLTTFTLIGSSHSLPPLCAHTDKNMSPKDELSAVFLRAHIYVGCVHVFARLRLAASVQCAKWFWWHWECGGV